MYLPVGSERLLKLALLKFTVAVLVELAEGVLEEGEARGSIALLSDDVLELVVDLVNTNLLVDTKVSHYLQLF